MTVEPRDLTEGDGEVDRVDGTEFEVVGTVAAVLLFRLSLNLELFCTGEETSDAVGSSIAGRNEATGTLSTFQVHRKNSPKTEL